MDAMNANVDPERLIEIVCQGTGVRRWMLEVKGNRHRQIVYARVVATGLLHEVALLSLTKVGPLLGTTSGVAHHRWRRWLKLEQVQRDGWIKAAHAAAA